jgi:DNA (cytosine-5)-methyltransferase 1
MMKPVVVIDLFAGAGGFTEGAISAGAKVAVAIDLWEPAVLLHRHNQPNVLMVQHELGNLRRDVQLIRKYLARYPNHHIHLHGSPPCQALSNASRTDASEGMGMIHHFLDLVDAIQPDSWSMENVVPMRKRLPEGTPSIILNSADFGVSQTRRRCIAGEGWEAIPTHSKEEWRSVLDALPHLAEELIGLVPAPSMTKQYQNASIEKPFPTVTSSSPRQLRMMINMVGGGSSPNRRVSSSDAPIDGPSKTVTGSSGAPSLRLEAMGSNAKRQADRAIDEPSKTICGSGDQVGPRIFDRSDTPVKIRSLTVQETATLQGFPATFEWELPGLRKKDIWTAIGNAVCPPVAEAIIRGIIQ